MKLIGYTTSYNVADIVPVVMPYVELLGYDKFIVYDNQSSDNTVELLQKYPFVEIREWDTGGKFDEIGKRNLEIGAFVECRDMVKAGEDVWMTWTDFDEVIYCFHEKKFKPFLDGLKGNGYNCVYDIEIQPMLPKGYIKEEVYDFIKNSGLPHAYPGVVVNHIYSKPLLFHINDFRNLYFVPGNHYALSEDDNVKNAEGFEISFFHMKYFFHDYGNEKNNDYVKINSSYKDSLNNPSQILYSASYPISLYFMEKWKSIDTNHLYYNGGNRKCWGKLVNKYEFNF